MSNAPARPGRPTEIRTDTASSWCPSFVRQKALDLPHEARRRRVRGMGGGEHMRKLFALALIALLALGLSVSVMSCGSSQQQESATTTEETVPAETPPTEMMPDTTAMDTTMSH